MELISVLITLAIIILGALGYLERYFNWQWSKETLITLLVIFVLTSITNEIIASVYYTNLVKYSKMAELNMLGKPYDDTKGGITITTPISGIYENTWFQKENNYYAKCDEKSILIYNELIAKYPEFPFPYYSLALCLKKNSNIQWKKIAKQGIKHFRMTTSISGHNTMHDQAMNELISNLEK